MNKACAGRSRHPSPVTLAGPKPSEGGHHVPAFTLMELLTVIAIIAVIAALLMPLVGAVKRRAYLQVTQAQMAQIETAIDRYKSAYGFYPPSNPNTVNNLASALNNQLYFELVGTTITANGAFLTLDGSATIAAANVNTAFGVSGFMNCSKTTADESAPQARDFLPDLKPDQIGSVSTNGVAISILVASVGGPDPAYQPLGVRDVNPWRYNSSNPANNPGSYDLYVQLVIAGKTNLICNWSKEVQLNSPLP
jgi:prepilin-type N-terminal cleavage/methylation domain-containing protein